MVRVLLVVLSLWTAYSYAGPIETYRFDNPEQEALYRKLIAELRCLVCQNQDLADSNADLAVDLRRKTYDMVSTGKSEQEVKAYMVARYGDFVLYRPPVKPLTFLLWGGPFIILAIGLFVLFRVIKRRSAEGAEVVLSKAERAKAEALLKGDDE